MARAAFLHPSRANRHERAQPRRVVCIGPTARMVRWICGDDAGSRLTSRANGEGSEMNERRLTAYGLGIRTTVAAPLSTSPTRVQPADGEGHRPSAARPRSIEGWPGRQAFPKDSALTWGRETSGPAHPNPNKRMKSKPARIRRSFPLIIATSLVGRVSGNLKGELVRQR